MSVCYLLAPLNAQLGTILHTISHSFEMPTNILSHNSNGYLKTEIHANHEHKKNVINHDHNIIEVIDAIVAHSNENDNPTKKHQLEIKVKKHLSTNASKLPPNLTRKTQIKFYPVLKSLPTVHLEQEKHPPKDIQLA